MWNLTHPPTARFPSPLFSNRWTGRFDGNWASRVGIERVEEFLFEIFRVTGSDFGLLTTEVDLKAKNTDASSFSYQGLNPADGVPGLYWVNLFSDHLAGWLGLNTISEELAAMRRLPFGGWLLKLCESPDQCRDTGVLQKQRAVIDWLGPEKFFDVRFPDRKLEVPDWNSAPFPNVESIV
jgi:hypothetical protein